MDTEGSNGGCDESSAQDSVMIAVKREMVWGRVLVRTIVACGAAFVAVKAIGRIGEVFVLPPDLASVGFGQVPSPEVKAKITAAVFSNAVGNAAIWMGTAGAILGTCLAVVVAFSVRKSGNPFPVIAGLVVAGASFSAFAGVLGVWCDSAARRSMAADASSPAEHLVVMIHGLVWFVVGGGIGVGVALGSRRPIRMHLETIATVALSGLLGGCLFPIVAGVFFPAIDSSSSIPGVDPPESRILWLCLPAVFIGCAVGRRE